MFVINNTLVFIQYNTSSIVREDYCLVRVAPTERENEIQLEFLEKCRIEVLIIIHINKIRVLNQIPT